MPHVHLALLKTRDGGQILLIRITAPHLFDVVAVHMILVARVVIAGGDCGYLQILR